MAITITRLDESADDLCRLARSSKNAAQARRRLAIALVLDGQSRTDVARASGMDRQSLRDGVHRFNAEGPAGLFDKLRSGRPPRMTAEQLQALDAVDAWAYLRGTKLARRLFSTYDDIVNTCCEAWNSFLADAKTIRSVTTLEWATCQTL